MLLWFHHPQNYSYYPKYTVFYIKLDLNYSKFPKFLSDKVASKLGSIVTADNKIVTGKHSSLVHFV